MNSVKIKPKVENCVKLNQCHKILMVLDHDLLDFQYKSAIHNICKLCKETGQELIVN